MNDARGEGSPIGFPLKNGTLTRWVIALLASLTIFHLWFATRLDLTADETYYWMWSRHLDWAYRDKGPLIAWTISLGTHLFGDTVFGVRFFAVILSTATAWELFRLGRRLYDERIGFLCAVVAALIPLFAIGSIVMTIDSLSVLFWAWGCNVFLNALEKDRLRDWLLLGTAVGLGFLAKFTNGVQFVGIGLFLLWSPAHRRFLLSRRTAWMGAAFALCCLPILYWNIRTGWLEISAVHSRSGVDAGFHIVPAEFRKFLGEEAAALSPLFFIGMMAAGLALLVRKTKTFQDKFLLTQFWPIMALFLFFSLNRAGKANWIAPGVIAGMVLTVVFWGGLARKGKGWKALVIAALALATLETVVLHYGAFGDISALIPRIKHDPARRSKGWRDFAAHVERTRETFHPDYLVANHYSQASELTFYLPDRPRTYTPNGHYGVDQFTLWGSYQVEPGQTALFVTDDTDWVPDEVSREFTSMRLVDSFWSMDGGRPMTEFRIFYCVREVSKPGEADSSKRARP